jgi:hypothetical protein
MAVRVVATTLMLTWSAIAVAEPMAAGLEGYWEKDGRCGAYVTYLIVTTKTVTFGKDKPYELDWIPNSSHGGHSTIRWRGEPAPSNLKYDNRDDSLRLYEPPWIMEQSPIIYRRCPGAMLPRS